VRPINLIPTEERRARGSSSRNGPLPFLVVGALAALLLGVVMLIHLSNQVSDRETEVANLQAEKAVVTAQAEKLAPFTAFAQVAEQRTSTIATLANDRFDWPRVVKQLSVVLPANVWFTSLSASAGAGGSEGGAVGVPSLSIQGCTTSQDAVAAFVSVLKQIDGVTRVGLESSVSGESQEGESVSGASPCSVGSKTIFSIEVVFDGAPPSPDGAAATAESESEATESGSESSEGEGSTEESEGSSSESETSESESTQSATTGEGGVAG
jgi:Tfp pilus assembly protein PilN